MKVQIIGINLIHVAVQRQYLSGVFSIFELVPQSILIKLTRRAHI